MSGFVIRLLGRPEIEVGGVVASPPRGHKAWAVLAYVALAERPVPRGRLAGLLFADASDPLGALRWALAQLRRCLPEADTLRGDPLELRPQERAAVDVLRLAAGDPDAGLARGELLDGVDPRAGAAFEAWLVVERRRAAGLCAAVLRDAALRSLAAGSPLDAAALASRTVALDAFDESAHELLVRCLARAGQLGAARHQVRACEVLFRRELGRDPDARVSRAATEPAGDDPPAVGDRAAVLGQLDAGRAALDAGAVEPGLACLRHAGEEARAVGDPALRARARAALGVALVHAVRGRDEEGKAALHEALVLARAAGDHPLEGKVCRELGFVEVQAGRGASAGSWLLQAGELAGDDGERAAVLGVRGMALSDRAHYEAAMALLRRSVVVARGCGDRRQAAWSSAILGRALLLRAEMPEAIEALDAALELVQAERWLAFLPFPEALRAEAALREGEPDRARALLAHAFALGCRLGDPCWEALATRVQGLAHAAAGERPQALACLRDAVVRAARVADPYVWIHAYCLEALAGVEIAEGAAEARGSVAELERLAARGDMRELLVRAALHRSRLGDPGAVAAARVLAEAIDNPALQTELAAAI